MHSPDEIFQCLNCERAETDIPLVALRYEGREAWICSQCLPILIHQPQRLVGRLDKADTITPVPPDTEL
jgi:hypothetical protein